MNNTPCKDHLGNKYESKKEMCEEWGIPFRTYMKRKKWGWNDKFALETPPNGYRK